MGNIRLISLCLILFQLSPIWSLKNRPDSWENDPYYHIVNLDSKGDFVLEYGVNWTNRTILFNVFAKTTGYVGFGITSTGKMSSADLVIGGVRGKSGEVYFYDMHVPAGTRHPVKDASQDYILHSAWENGTHTSLSFSRELETCDSDDHTINDDTIKLIWAFGEKDDISQYHYQNRGEYPVYILNPDYTPRPIQEAKRLNHTLNQKSLGDDIRVWTVTRRMLIPPEETTYWCSFLKGPVLNKEHHMIGFDFRIENEIQARHTHHLDLYICKPPPGEDAFEFFQPYVQNNTGESCVFLRRGRRYGTPLQNCREIVYPYSIGMRMYFLASHLGITMGSNPDEYFMLQVHYDNPHRRADLEYDINIDVYYTPNLREHNVGIFTVGHSTPGPPSLIIPPMSQQHSIYSMCGSDCTREIIPPEGINVVGLVQHTHYSGVRARLRHFRGQREIQWIANDDNYSNLNQFFVSLRTEVKLLPGDQLVTECVYNNSWANGRAVVGGYSTEQEMCLVFLYVYNKIEYAVCRSEITDPTFMQKHFGVRNASFWSEPDLEFVVSEPRELEGLTYSEIATNRINWTEDKRKELANDQKYYPHQNNCPNNNAVTNGETTVPKVVWFPDVKNEYKRKTEAERKCKWKEGHGWIRN